MLRFWLMIVIIISPVPPCCWQEHPADRWTSGQKQCQSGFQRLPGLLQWRLFQLCCAESHAWLPEVVFFLTSLSFLSIGAYYSFQLQNQNCHRWHFNYCQICCHVNRCCVTTQPCLMQAFASPYRVLRYLQFSVLKALEGCLKPAAPHILNHFSLVRNVPICVYFTFLTHHLHFLWIRIKELHLKPV